MNLNQYPKFTLGLKLTQEQTEFFNKHGFIHFERFITPDIVGMIINASKEVEKLWIENNVEKVNGVPIKYGYDIDGQKIVQRFAFTSHYHPFLHEFLKDDRFKALLDLIQGENPRIGEFEKDGMVFNHYINTENSKFTKMGWHTDSLRDIFLGKKILPMLNVGIHLSDFQENNGGLRIIPGTHNQSLHQLLFRKKYFMDHKEDKNEVSVKPMAGDLTVHDGRLWHRVAQSNLKGEVSRRRVIYVPFISGPYQPKHANSKTALYQRFSHLVK